MTYSRKHDFQPGTKISSDQVDEEFNNLITAVNEVDSESRNNRVPYTGASKDVDLNGKRIINMQWVDTADTNNDGVYYRIGELDDGTFVHRSYNNGVTKDILKATKDGYAQFPNNSRIELIKNTDGDIPASSSTLIRFDSIVADRNTEVATDRLSFKFKDSGLYVIQVHARFDAASYPTAEWYLQLVKEGAVDFSFQVNDGKRQGNICVPFFADKDKKYQVGILQYSAGTTKKVNYVECRVVKVG